MDKAHTRAAPWGNPGGTGGTPGRVATAYQGVWTRTLLETPAGRDTSSGVRWVQTACAQGAVDGRGQAVTQGVDAPGAAHSVFQTPERIVQTGLQDRHLAIWERQPDSHGLRLTLARRDAQGQPTRERLLVCGDYLLHRVPGDAAAPDATHADTLHFGRLCAGASHWQVELASDAAQVGQVWPWRLQRLGMDLAVVGGEGPLAGAWEVLEWGEG